MAKKSQKRSLRHERVPSGCMWGLISMFDFRQVQSTQRLLSDKKLGAGVTKSKLALLTYSQHHNAVDVDERNVAAHSIKPSVKKLIEEEMVSEPDAKETNDTELESKLEDGKEKKKKWKIRGRSRTRSGNVYMDEMNIADKTGAEQLFHHNSDKEAKTGLDIDKMVEEFCCQIHQTGINSLKHDQHNKDHGEPNSKNAEFEQKLIEAIKLFISLKLNNEKCAFHDGESQESRELCDVLQFLSSDQELSLKLSQDKKSVMVKHFQNLWNSQLEKSEGFNPLLASNLSVQEPQDSKQLDEVIHNKHSKFFRRKSKSMDESSLMDNGNSQTKRIVILKPGPRSLQHGDLESSLGLSVQSEFSMRRNVENEKNGSYYFLSEIKRRLKHAMGKDRQGISSNVVSKKFPKEHLSRGNAEKGLKENSGMNSSSKEHFFIEKAARSPKKGDKSNKLIECEVTSDNKTPKSSKVKESKIYIEAKKHLSDILSDGAIGVSPSRRRVSLGRILHLPEYNPSPISRPARDWGQRTTTAQTISSAKDKIHKPEDNQQSLLSVSTNDKGQAPADPTIASDVLVGDVMAEYTSTLGGGLIVEGVVETSETAVQNESITLDTLSEPDGCSLVTEEDGHQDLSAISDNEQQTKSLNLDSNEQNEPPSSPVTSIMMPSVSNVFGNIECAPGTPERPSPISVLELTFSEEDISPASTRLQQSELLVQPLLIEFEEHFPSATEEGTKRKICKEDKEMAFEYVKAVLEASGLIWEEVHARLSYSSDQQLLDPRISDEVEFFPTTVCGDEKLLFDCINEVLVEIYSRYFVCFLGQSSVKPIVRPLPDVRNVASEIWEGVYCHLLPLPLPHTLDQLVKKDMEKAGTWMDLQYDIVAILDEMSEIIFDDLMEEDVFGCLLEDCDHAVI